MPRLLPSLALLSACLLGCQPEPSRSGMRLVSWPGQDGAELALDQDLRLEFDLRLSELLRPGAVEVHELGPEGEVDGACRFQEMRVTGRFLSLRPRLPLEPDLEDGTLAPGRRYRVVLRGLPQLGGLSSEDGVPLLASARFEFRTLPRDDAAALSGRSAPGDPLRPVLARPFRTVAPQRAEMRLPFSHPIDPRSLAPATLERSVTGRREDTKVALRLVRNEIQGAELAVELGSWQGSGTLVLPAGLEGLGGRPLDPSRARVPLRRPAPGS